MLGRERREVVVIGAGPIGLAIAWRCAQQGMRVTVHDPAVGSGASDVAAGMLAPVAEAYFGEEALTALLVESARRWPSFVKELRAASGMEVGYRTEGTLVVALTSDDLAAARRLWTYQQGLGLAITAFPPGRLREREPLLSPRVRGGALAPDDHQLDPRRLVTALAVAAERAGVGIIREPVTTLAEVVAETVVVAAGHATAALTGLPLRPVKGQVLRLRAPGDATLGFRHVIRGYADGRPVYLVPRDNGEVVVGATVEECGDVTVTAGAVLDLLRAAVDLMPAIAEYDLVEARAGLRPGTPDNAPVLGALPDRPNVIAAAGHYRHGIVLTPVTADLIAELVATGVPNPMLAPFAPHRFEIGAVGRIAEQPTAALQ